jgi:hypothetical protein
MKRPLLLILLLIIFARGTVIGQAKTENKLKFYDAESWVLYEDYQEALKEYLELIKSYPKNFNIKYRIGQCYLNVPGEKDKAIPYLEDAVNHINPKYKEGKFKETGAPYDVYYYLANAYRIDNQLDKALEAYKTFQKNLDPKVYDTATVNQQIQSCYNAKDLMAMPLYVRKVNLGKNINSIRAAYNPVVTDDGKTLFFTKATALYDALLVSKKNPDGTWGEPDNLNAMLAIDNDIYPTSVSHDGKTLYLYRSASYDGVIYTTTMKDGVWGPLVKLNENINTKFWESHATISHDNKKLYFTSNRKGGFNGLDIYVSERDSTGDWGPAVNLGAKINTPFNEETPFLSKDDKTLFFSSRGHLNMGGYDIFYSTLLANGEWSVPLNVGYPLNTTDDDIFFDPINAGYEGFLAQHDSKSSGPQDIYKIEIFSDQHPRKFIVRGMVRVADLISSFKDSVRISAMNIKDPNQTIVVYSNPKTGEYEFHVPQGNYEVTFDSPLSEKQKRTLNLDLTNPSDSFILPGTILPKTDFTADLDVKTSKTIAVTKGDSILFPLKVEPDSKLTVEHWVGDKLISTEVFNITDSLFNYKMAPLSGDNKVTFKLSDKFNNTTTTDVFITRQKGLLSQPVVRPEYSRIIAKKQIAAFTQMLLNRSDDKLKKVITNADIDHQQFGKVDDLISYIKAEAAKSSISPEDVDRLALKVAVMDNILTQAAVDLMAKYAEGDLRKLLSGVDIYKQNLKTWTELQEYIAQKSGNAISPADLNTAAADILISKDPAIDLIKDKIMVYGQASGNETTIRQSIEAADKMKIKKSGSWLQAFYNESRKRDFRDGQFSDLVAAVGAMPGTRPDKFAAYLADNAEEPLAGDIRNIDFKKGKIKTPSDLVMHVLQNKGNAPDELIFNSFAKVISKNNVPNDAIKASARAFRHHCLWYLWVLAGLAAFIFFILFKRRKDKKKEVKE